MGFRDEDIAALDRDDPLRAFRSEFAIPRDQIYLDGNSLGAMPRKTAERMQHIVEGEWGDGLINSWNDAGWIDAPRRVGDKIARLIGAGKGEVIVADSTSVNIFKALAAALSLQKGRGIILTETGNFPTDLYVAKGLAGLASGGAECLALSPGEVLDRLDSDVAVLLLTHVHYKTGLMRDLLEVTRRAHESGVLTLWDLSHSTGAMEIDLNAAKADFAVGCGYKYLNGGPGAPAYIFAAERHHEAQPVLSGWFGHSEPFAFEDDYRAASGIDRFQCGTPGILGLGALECGVDLMLRADMSEIRRKSVKLAEFFEVSMRPLCSDYGFELASPLEPQSRGSHLAYRHEHAHPMIQALKAAGVIGDFRAPDLLRIGFTPLYQTFADIKRAVDQIAGMCRERSWDRPEFRQRQAVT